MSGPRLFTLWVLAKGARLLDGAGNRLAELAGPSAQDFRELLPPRAPVQLILDYPQLAIQCQEVPRLSSGEQREVHGRLAELQPEQQLGQALEVDPGAQGGHILWMASQPRQPMEAWLDALVEAGVRPVFAMPWQRAFLAALPADASGGLYLLLEPGAGRLLFFKGRSLRFLRLFPLPEPLAADALVEELARLRQFVQQKNRGAEVGALHALGLPEALARAVAEGLDLTLDALERTPAAFLLAGAARERQKGLDLLPVAIREARRRRVFRAVVWTAAGGLLALAAGTKAVMVIHETGLRRELVRAEEARAQREILYREGQEAARLRFGLLRLRWAEERQVQATERMEQLGLRIFQTPPGVTLGKVDIRQVPGDPVEHRFTIEGTAVTRQGFSMGSLAEYYQHLASYPDLRLEPLKEVSVLDRPGPGAERALTQFRLEGTAP